MICLPFRANNNTPENPGRRKFLKGLFGAVAAAAGIGIVREVRTRNYLNHLKQMQEELVRMGVEKRLAGLLAVMNHDVYSNQLTVEELHAISEFSRRFGENGVHPLRIIRNFEFQSPQYTFWGETSDYTMKEMDFPKLSERDFRDFENLSREERINLINAAVWGVDGKGRPLDRSNAKIRYEEFLKHARRNRDLWESELTPLQRAWLKIQFTRGSRVRLFGEPVEDEKGRVIDVKGGFIRHDPRRDELLGFKYSGSKWHNFVQKPHPQGRPKPARK